MQVRDLWNLIFAARTRFYGFERTFMIDSIAGWTEIDHRRCPEIWVVLHMCDTTGEKVDFIHNGCDDNATCAWYGGELSGKCNGKWFTLP